MIRRRLFYMLLTGLIAWSFAYAGRAQVVEWTRQIGTTRTDRSSGVSADQLGNVYIAGWTTGSLGGPRAGFFDAFVSKYDAAGTLEWTRQLGTTWTQSWGVSADGLGSVYLSGYTEGNMGGPNAGSGDAFVSKYDAVGTLEWSRQLGTTSSEISYGVSADGLGNVYLSGATGGSLGGASAGEFDAFVSKFDAAGNFQWTRQLGTTDWDVSYGVSADGLGNVYISGYTFGSLGGASAGNVDAFVSKFDDAGTLQWTRQLGTTSGDMSFCLSADGLGNVYISGRTQGSLGGPHGGGYDAFVSKYDAAGTLEWTRQLGTISDEESFGVSADGLGNVYLSGYTLGSLGDPNAGSNDAFVSKYDSAGTHAWTHQLGTTGVDRSAGVSADRLGNVYISGWTTDSLGGPNAGGDDAFVVKIADTVGQDGDFDGDDDVDGNDFLVWQRGESPSGLSNVDLIDWKANFGAPASATAEIVPEPATSAFAVLALLLTIAPRAVWHRHGAVKSGSIRPIR